MTERERRRFEMLVRVDGFGRAFASLFSPTSRAAQLFALLRTLIEAVHAHTTTQLSGEHTAQQKTSSKQFARALLIEQMKDINRLARAMGLAVPGLDDKFRLPGGDSDQAWLIAGRTFAQDAVAFRTEFLSREMPESFIDDLNAAIADFEQAIDERNLGTGTHVAATVSTGEAIGQGLDIVHELHAIMRIKLRGDRATLAEWMSASHIERHSSKSTPPTDKPAPPSEDVK